MRKRMVLLALVVSSSAHAQVSEARLTYRAPPACPDRAFFNERMAARLRADGARARAAELHVVVELDARGARGSVSVEHGGHAARRSLEAASCREVVEGLALIAALAIAEPNRPESTRAAPRPRAERKSIAAEGSTATGGGVEGGAAGAAPSGRESASGAAGATAPGREPASSAAESTASEREQSGAAGTTANGVDGKSSNRSGADAAAAAVASESSQEDRDTAVDESEAPASRDSGKPLALRLDAALLALHGFAPDVRPGLQLGAAAVLGAFSAHVAGRVALPETVHSPDGDARFGLYAALIELCGSAELARPIAWYACGVAEPGMFTAAGENTKNAKDHYRPWLALGGGTGFRFGLGDGLGLRAGAELLVPTRHDRALLAGRLVHEVTAACLRVQLGIEAQPW